MNEPLRVAGVVLAAGFSRRLGRPKQTVVLAGETLVERAARTAFAAGLKPVLVVLNPQGLGYLGLIATKLEALGCTLLVNEGATEGMAASIRLAVATLEQGNVEGAVLMTCDQVAVTPEHLQALCASREEIGGSGYAGKVGIPAYFPVSRFGDLGLLRGDQGARELLRGARCVLTEALALDVDTEEELKRAQEWLAE